MSTKYLRSYKQFLLGEKANEYINGVLKKGKLVSKNILRYININEGVSSTYCEFDILETDLLNFKAGGKVPVNDIQYYIGKDGNKYRYEGFKNLVEPIVPIIQDYLKKDPLHVCIFELIFPRKSGHKEEMVLV